MKHIALLVSLAFLVGCSTLQEWTQVENVKVSTKGGEQVGCGPIDPITKLQACYGSDGKGNTTNWTINHNEKVK